MLITKREARIFSTRLLILPLSESGEGDPVKAVLG
jgi:hypothetical protein